MFPDNIYEVLPILLAQAPPSLKTINIIIQPSPEQYWDDDYLFNLRWHMESVEWSDVGRELSRMQHLKEMSLHVVKLQDPLEWQPLARLAFRRILAGARWATRAYSAEVEQHQPLKSKPLYVSLCMTDTISPSPLDITRKICATHTISRPFTF